MNAISKRLLSWLCVIAMVLSFVPVMNLAGLAVETQAAEEIVYGSANLSGVDAAIISQMNAGNAIDNSDAAFEQHLANNTCPVCGNIDGWTKRVNASGKTYASSVYYGGENHTGMKLHYYYDDTVTVAAGNMVGFAEKATNNTACIWIKSTQNITNDSTRAVMLSSTNVVNIFGEGSLTTTAAAKYNMFQIGNKAVLNLYGGNFVYEHPQENFQLAAIRFDGNGTVNIFDGVKVGPATQDDTKVCMNVQYKSAGTLNMFGGEIRNGVSPAWGYSGNVNVAAGGTFNMYGGTISGGTFLSKTTSGVTSNATLGGNVMVGGKNQETFFDKVETKDETTGEVLSTTYKDNYTTTAGTFNMYGGTITGGKCNNGGNGGGNINIYNGGSVANILGGTIENGYAKGPGGNIQISGGTMTIGGTALITGGSCGGNGGNIYMNSTSAKLIINGGKIADGKANIGKDAKGGNIFVCQTKGLNISGGVISGGESNGNGGNLCFDSVTSGGKTYYTDPTKVSITGGTFEDGISNNQGGNISVNIDVEIANATVTGGIGRKGGGNINASAGGKTLTLTDCTVANGWVSGAINADGTLTAPGGANWGGNVRVWCGNLVVDGGLYYGGMRGVDKKGSRQDNNIAVLASIDKTGTANVAGASLTIKGDAIIVGDVSGSAPTANETGTYTCPGTTVKLEGAPQIVNKYTLADGNTVTAKYGGLTVPSSASEQKVDISGLTTDAYVMFTTPDHNGKTAAETGRVVTLPAANAAALAEAGCFGQTNGKWAMAVNEANELYVIVKPEEKPKKPVAAVGGQDLTDAVWETMLTAQEIQAAALKLDPKTATTCPACGATGITWTEAVYPNNKTTADSAHHYYLGADTKVTKGYNWYAANAKNVTICLLLTNGATEKNIGGLIGTRNAASGCTLNIMGNGIVKSDASNTSDGQFGVIGVQGTGNTVNLYGGTYIFTGHCEDLTKTTVDGKTVYTPNGKIAAGAIYLRGNNNTVNMFNETTVGPETQDLTKGYYNVRIKVDTANNISTFNMYGGTIRNGVTEKDGVSGNITTEYLANTATYINIYGGTIENGSYVESAYSSKNELKGGNIYAAAATHINMYGGTIKDGNATYGGNVFMAESSVSEFNMHAGTLSSGNAKLGGGNLHTTNKFVNIGQYGLIENGTAGFGGNININKYSVTTSGVIRDGKATQYGGNINVNKYAVVVDGGVISGGTVTEGNAGGRWGGNIRSWNGQVTINGGLIYGGNRIDVGNSGNRQANNIGALGDTNGAALTITGGTIVGDIGTSSPKADGTFVGTAVTLSGSPKILVSMEIDGKEVTPTAGYGLYLASGNQMNIDNLKADAQIVLSLTSQTQVISTARADAETVADCFTAKNYAKVKAAKNADNKLQFVKCAGAIIDENGNEVLYVTNEEALAAYDIASGKAISLTGEAEVNEPIILDAQAGAVTISGTGEITLIDPANKDFKTTHKITIAGENTVKLGETIYEGDRYITLKNGNEYSAHYIEMKLTAVTLRTGAAPGLYYKASYKCDADLRDRVLGYGAAISTVNMPGADFMEDGDGEFTSYSDADFKSIYGAKDQYVVANTTGSVVGILKAVGVDGRTAADNIKAADINLYANLYMAIDLDGSKDVNKAQYIMTDYDNCGKTVADAGFNGTAFSLNSIVAKIDAAYESYGDAQKAIIDKFMETWGAFLTGNFKNL